VREEFAATLPEGVIAVVGVTNVLENVCSSDLIK
jgi:hypothetical protein